MGLIKDTQNIYYNGNDFGGYQFTSLDDIITQFEIAYVGENKIIPKIKRADIAFHAMRALQELSFDTFKSVKAQEIVLPQSLTMVLPQDYVNYTKLSWVDSAGIKHPLYPTSKTSNPFKIQQFDSGVYSFAASTVQAIVNNSDFSEDLNPNNDWNNSNVPGNPSVEDISSGTGSLKITHGSKALGAPVGQIVSSRAYAIWQPIDVSEMDTLTISASGVSAAASSGVKDAGILRFGIVSSLDTPGGIAWDKDKTNPNSPIHYNNAPSTLNEASRNHLTNIFDLQTSTGDPSYIEFNDGLGTASTKTLEDIKVSDYSVVYLVITSYIPNYTTAWTVGNSNESSNIIDDIDVLYDGVLQGLQSGGESTTWSNYKSNTPSENNNDDYEDDTYWPMDGSRFGLDPQHAQANGSFYIDNRMGKINFSSNISGKTVILDYISDSLGTDAEMQVHKFAEDAMYKWIAHAILSTSTYGQGLVNRLAREKFAATRKAKLRLSNIKIEELTQILRGKSKHIKH